MNLLLTYLLFGISLFTQGLNSLSKPPELFNLGRTRCYFGGMSISEDGKSLFHTHIFAPDSTSPFLTKISLSEWKNNQWSEPAFINFFPGYSESYPVWIADKNRLYFSSSHPASEGDTKNDLNIWYAEKNSSGWSKPQLASALNSEKNDRLAFIDEEGYYYIIVNKNESNDIFRTRLQDNEWSKLESVDSWNSAHQEESVSVYPRLKVAFIQRSISGISTEILVSKLEGGNWTTPVPLSYDSKTTQMPYVQRWPMLSGDLGTFYFVSQGLIWQQSTSLLLQQNNVASAKNLSYKSLPVKKRVYGEPEVFGGMTLKTNNGITFTPDGKTVYLSRYTEERDSMGRQFIKIFQSNLEKEKWSNPVLVTFNKPEVPFEYHPVLAPDGNRLFYNSRAPRMMTDGKYLSKNNLWYVDKLSDGSWGNPILIESLATDEHDDYASVDENGNLYFRSDRPGGKGAGDIYRSDFIDGKYQQPVNVHSLNSNLNENDLCIDPKGRFIVFNRYVENGDQSNIILYISIKVKNEWTQPRIIKQLEKPYDYELTPTLSQDGRYFYYEVNSNMMRVEMKSLFTKDEIDLLKKQH